MSFQKVKVSDLVSLIPDSYFDEIAEQTNVDYQVKKLNGKLIFNLLLMSVLHSERLSLRVMEQLFSTPRFKKFAQVDDSTTTRHSSIRDRISTINKAYFEELFYKISSLINTKFKHKDYGKYSVERFDSTVVSLSSKLLKFGMYSGSKTKDGSHKINQLKFTIGFNGLTPRKVNIYSEQKYLGENDTLFETLMNTEFEKNTIAVFDRGLNSRERFKKINDANKLFVTRINPTKNYKILKELIKETEETDTLIIEQDLEVYLKGAKSSFLKSKIRLIIARNKETNEKMYFVSNINDLEASDITEIYKMRWDIEVFF
jgi:hypothetical protein